MSGVQKMADVLAEVLAPPADVPSLQLPSAEGEQLEDVPNGAEEGMAADEGSLVSSPTSPQLPLPDFMTALNMKPQFAPSQQQQLQQGGEDGKALEAPVEAVKEQLVLGPGPKEALAEKFKQG